MSFSFNVRGADKAEVKQMLSAKLDDTVAQQPIHEADRAAIQSAAEAHLDLLADSDDHDFNLTVNGWVQTTGDDVTGVNLGVTANRVAREQAEA